VVTRTWTFVDACGNSSSVSQTINVNDDIAPVAPQAPANVTVQCASDVPAMVSLTALDNCTGEISAQGVDSITQGSCVNNFVVTRTWTFVDACGNSSSVTQTINVNDTTPPTFVGNLPQNITVQCDAVPVVPTLTAIDNCGNATISYTETSGIQGTCPNNYTIVRNWTATDSCGNSTTVSQTITVQDTTAPTLVGSIVSPINVTCSEIPSVPELTFVDNCAGQITVNYSSTTSEINDSGNYTITRTWLVTDACNNSQTFTQIINVSISNYMTEVNLVDGNCNNIEGFTVNLNTKLTELFPTIPTNGSWEDTDDTGQFTNGILSPFGLSIATYQFTYTYGTVSCPQKIVFNVDVDVCIVAGCESIEVHNVVTPNNDGFNDYLQIDNIEDLNCYPENNIQIFSRWGVLVYEVDNYDNTKNKFEGISQGRATVNPTGGLPAGTYFYILKYKTSEGNYVTRNGYLYLNK
jgi:gliding motility-associated-like protein